jgi:hypothetical protein
MRARSLALCTLAGVFSLAFVSSGCEGDPSGTVTDGSVERPTSTGGTGGGTGGSGGGGRGGNPGPQPDARQNPDTPPPVPNAASVKILPGQTDLLGSFQNGCTFGPGGERWCAVSRPVALTRRELWFVNVTKAAAMRMTLANNGCDVAGLCVRATDQLYTARPPAGPAYPEDAARASGNTFIYLSDPVSAASEVFQGDVWAHTIGSPNTTRVGTRVYDCAVAGQRYIFPNTLINKVVGICAGDPSSAAMEEPAFFTLKGGPVAGQDVPGSPAALPLTKMMGAELPTVPTGYPDNKLFPSHPETGALRWRVGFSADGETLILSSGGPTLAETEKLSTIPTSSIGTGGTLTAFPGGENITRWTLSANGQKIYYFKEYNYNGGGNQSGTLAVADFPSGANPKDLRGMLVPGGTTGGVGAYRVLVNDTGIDSGVGVMSGLAMGRGSYSIIKNPVGSMDDAANVVSVVQATRSLPIPSPKLDFNLYALQFSEDSPTSDIWVARSDATRPPCSLTSGIEGGIFGFPFSLSSGLVFWADNYDALTLSADGWLTEPGDCANPGKKRQFASNVDFWFVDDDRMLVYSDSSDGNQVTLKYAPINGNTLGAPVTIQTRADRFFQIVSDAQPMDGSSPRFKAVVYTLSGGSDDVNGVYYYDLTTGGSTPIGDAGAGGG